MKYSVVIATLDRPKSLSVVLDCLSKQIRLPEKVIIVDASSNQDTKNILGLFPLNFEYIKVDYRSSAKQRNLGATYVNSELIVFMDDDIEFDQDITMLLNCFLDNTIGGISPLQENICVNDSSIFLKLYYFLQSGQLKKSYGAYLFGPGISVYPTKSQVNKEIIQSNWLPATFLLLRTELFLKYKFPLFDEYSFAEDVYLTNQISNVKNLLFVTNYTFKHHSNQSDFKSNTKNLVKMKLRNMEIVAIDVLGVNKNEVKLKMLFHRLFLTFIYLLHKKTRKEIKFLWN